MTRTETAWSGRRGIALVAAVALAASLVGIRNDFTNDDIHLIANNARVQDLANWSEWIRLPFWPPPYSPDLYRPVTSALLALEYIAGAGSPAVFRIVSYLLYAACAVGVFSLAKRMLPETFAFGAALLFAAHPVHVEAVALGVGQSELAVALIAMAMCVRYIDRRRGDGLRRKDWLILGMLYAVACLTKEHGLVIPGLLVAAELVLISAPKRAVMPGLAGLTVIAAAVLFVRHLVLGDVGGSFTAEALVGLGAGGRALTMLAVVPRWLHLLAWPSHLQADYSPREIVASPGFGITEAAGLIVVMSVLIAGWAMRRRSPAVSFGIAWMAITLLPVSNVIIPTGIVLAERTLFLPSVGFVITVTALVDVLLSGDARLARPVVCAGLVLVAIGVGRSVERQRVWRNEGYLVGRSVQDAPLSFRMQEAYGDLLFGADQPELAHQAYARAMDLAPRATTWRVQNDLGRALARRGDTAEQAVVLRASLAQQPDQELIRAELVAAQLVLGEYTDARSVADSGVAMGKSVAVFAGLRAVADSALRSNAPPGSIRLSLQSGALAPSR